MPLLGTDAIKTQIETYEYFSGSFGDQSFAAQLYLSADSKGITVLLLNDFGIQMGILTYDGETASLESSMFPKRLKCEYILLDLQNAYCDTEALKEHYKQYGFNFTEEMTDSKTVRKVMNGKKVIEEITIEGSDITIVNYLREYKYELTGADDE